MKEGHVKGEEEGRKTKNERKGGRRWEGKEE